MRGEGKAYDPFLYMYAAAQSGWAPLHRAVDAGDGGVLALLLGDPRVDVNATTQAREEEEEGARRPATPPPPRLTFPAPIICQLGWTALHYAADLGHAAAARQLLGPRRTDAMARDGIVRRRRGAAAASSAMTSCLCPPTPPLAVRALAAPLCGRARGGRGRRRAAGRRACRCERSLDRGAACAGGGETPAAA